MADWHHAPIHRLGEHGAYIVTAGTYRKHHLLQTDRKLQLVHDSLLELAGRYGWSLQAWAVLSNHYHFVAIAPEEPKSLGALIKHLHSDTARRLNQLDGASGRRVWYQYWESKISFENSYLARLRYVHLNPVKHGLAQEPTAYKWSSAKWFELHAPQSLVKTVESFKVERVNVFDDF